MKIEYSFIKITVIFGWMFKHFCDFIIYVSESFISYCSYFQLKLQHSFINITVIVYECLLCISVTIYIMSMTNNIRNDKFFANLWQGYVCNDPNLVPKKISPVRPNYIAENHNVSLFKMGFRGGLWQRLLGMAKPCRNVTGTGTNNHHEREAIPPSEKRE